MPRADRTMTSTALAAMVAIAILSLSRFAFTTLPQYYGDRWTPSSHVHPMPILGCDFEFGWVGGQCIRNGVSPYVFHDQSDPRYEIVLRRWNAALRESNIGNCWGPLTYHLMVPLSFLDRRTAYRLVCAGTIAAWLVSGLLLISLFGPSSRWPLVVFLAALTATSYPLEFLMERGNYDGFVLVLMAVGVWLVARDARPGLAGLFLAAGALIKLYPALLLAPMVIRRHRVAAWAIGWGLAIVALTLHHNLYGEWLGSLIRLSAANLVATDENHSAPWPLLLVMYSVTLRLIVTHPPRPLLEAGALALVALSTPRVTGDYNLVVTLIPALAYLHVFESERSLPPVAWALVGLAGIAAIHIPVTDRSFWFLPHALRTPLLTKIPGIVMLWSAIVRELRAGDSE